MALNAADVSSLTKSLSDWEIAEYFCCGFVAVACAGEYIADFTNWLTGGDEWRKKRLAKRSTLLLIVSLACELFCLVQTNSISGRLVGSLSDKATNAETKAQSALDKSGTAETKADAASKQYDDLLSKYTAAEREIIELKAAKLHRRLSSGQKATLRKMVATFGIKTISLSCVAGSTNEGVEALDFELDLFNAFTVNSPLKVGSYNISCSTLMGAAAFIPPMQVDYGTQREGDKLILVKALEEIGIKKNDIVTKANANNSLLILTVGPKPE